jgi:hypothetical protein
MLTFPKAVNVSGSRCQCPHGRLDSRRGELTPVSRDYLIFVAYYVARRPTAFLLAAQRAFISWESLFRPAGVIPPFFLGVVFIPAFCLAQRALASAASLARVADDIRRRPPRVEGPGAEVPRIDERRFSKASICRRIEMASSSDLRDMRCRPLGIVTRA